MFFIFYTRDFFNLYIENFPNNLIKFNFKFLPLIYKFNYNNVIVIIYTL